MDIQYTFDARDFHLEQIIELQRQNLKANIGAEEAESQGFVTLEHDFDLLKKMHIQSRHLVALDDDKVIAYALAMTPSFRDDFPLLDPMFNIIEDYKKSGILAPESTLLIMGQVCVSKEYRGQGVFRKLYNVYLDYYKSFYDLVVTEIAVKNERSLEAHKSIGFRELTRYKEFDSTEWVICLI